MSAIISTNSVISLKTRGSWDTQQSLTYNPHRTYPKKPSLNPNPNSTSTLVSPSLDTNTVIVAKPVKSLNPSLLLTRNDQTPRKGVSPPLNTNTIIVAKPVKSFNPSLLLTRNDQKPRKGESGETMYLGYDTWLPSPPNVESPRSIYNAAQLAYIGDSIYELYARRHFLFPPLNIEEYNDRVMAVVRCEAQDAMLQKLLDEKYLSEDERDVLRWGKNIGSSKTRTKKRVGAAVYNRASSLETLVGYLYLTDKKRLEEIMLKLGFSCN